MATVISPEVQNSTLGDNLYWRCVVTYSTADNGSTFQISYSAQVQSKGTYKNNSVSGSDYRGGEGYAYCQSGTSKPGISNAVSTGVKKPNASSSSWTNRGTSSTGTVTVEKKTYAQTYGVFAAISAGIGSPILDSNQNVAGISIPAIASYTITYNSNGGTGGPTTSTKYEYSTLTLSSVVPSKAGYEFWHWNTAIDNSGTSYSPGGSYTANAAATLYAIWNPIITFNDNEGTGGPVTQTKTYGTNLTLSSTTPTRAYATFVEWNTSPDGTGTSYQPGDTYSAETPLTLYAIWLLDSDLPSITSMSAIRWDFTNSVQKEDSTSAKVEVAWYIDTSVTNSATVTLTVVGPPGSTAPTITSVSGTSGTSGTAIFRVDGVELTYQYVCTATVTDQYFSSSRSNYLTKAYFIFDFKAGGNAVGLGRVAPASGLGVGYNTVFDGDVTVLGTLTAAGGGGGLTILESETTASTTVGTSVTDVTSLTLSAGTWLINTYAYCSTMGTAGNFRTYVSSTSGSYTEVKRSLDCYVRLATYSSGSLTCSSVVTLSSSTTLYLLGQAPSAGCLITAGAMLEAIKLG